MSEKEINRILMKTLGVLIVIFVVIILCAGYVHTQKGFVREFPWITNKVIYLDESGKRAFGLREIGDYWYYFDEKTGHRQYGFQEIEGDTYYFDQDGKSVKGLKNIEDSTYYFDGNGIMAKERFVSYEKNGKNQVSYFGKDGKIVKGSKKIDGVQRHFDKKGNLTVDTKHLENEIQKILNVYDPDAGVFYYDIKTGSHLSINDKEMDAGGMLKLPVLAEAYNQVRLGKLSYEENQNIFDYMLPSNSDFAYNNLVYLIQDLDKVNRLCEKYDMNSTKIEGGFSAYSSNKNISTPSDIGKFLIQLYDGDIVSQDDSEKIIQILKKIPSTEKLSKGLPENVEFAHQSGSRQDGGIIYLPKAPYVLVVFSSNGMQSSSLMEQISSCVYDFQQTSYNF